MREDRGRDFITWKMQADRDLQQDQTNTINNPQE
jgi:hypothetical protein